MASKIPSKILQNAQRCYGAAAAAAAAPKAGLQVTQLESGAVVASAESHSPLTRVAVIVRGGASANNFHGASSVFKTIVDEGFSTPNSTGFHLTRLREAAGICIDMQSDKELLCYHGVANRDNVHHLFSLLADLTSNDQYRPYECPVPYPWPMSITHGPRCHDRLKAVMAGHGGQWHALNLVYKAAFRAQPLGNTDVVPEHMYSQISADLINEFVHNSHGCSGLVVVGSGLEHEMLLEGAETFGVKNGGVKKGASQFLGGDARVDAAGDLAHVCLAGPAPAFAGDRAASLVAAELLNTGAATPAGASCLAVAGVAPGLVAHGFCHNHSSAGLLGAYFSTPAASAGQVTAGMASFLRTFKPSDEDVAMAKACAKAKLASVSGVAELAHLGAQLAHVGEVTDDLAAVDAVTAPAVAQVLSGAFGGKLSVGAYGNIDSVPYSDAL